jgi:hypothetical protein
VFGSGLVDLEGMAWDNNGRYLYLSRTPNNDEANGPFYLYRYDPETNVLDTNFGSLPYDTDALDFAPEGYMGGLLVGEFQDGSNVGKFYTYDVEYTRDVVEILPRVDSTTYTNFDAFALCVPSNVIGMGKIAPTPLPTKTFIWFNPITWF